VSEYMGTAKNIPDREVSDMDSIKKAVGNPDDILGPIPTIEEMNAETSKNSKFEEEVDEEYLPDKI